MRSEDGKSDSTTDSMNEGLQLQARVTEMQSGSVDVFAQTLVQTPHMRLKMTAPEQVPYGKVFLLRFVIENVGTINTRSSVLRLDLQDNLAYRGHQKLDCHVDPLEPGEVKHARLSVLANGLGTQQTKAEILSNGQSMHTATSSITVISSTSSTGVPPMDAVQASSP